MEKAMMSGYVVLAAALLAFPVGAFAEEEQPKDRDALARALGDAKVPLDRGVSASAHEGKPISAKYELEDGKLQLSVYTAKGDKYSEVIVDHTTGKVAKAESITSGEDLSAAKEQQQAMAKAKRSLQQATADATKKNHGYRAVSAIPELESGHPVAKVTLVKGDDWKTVAVKLDSTK